ncbi:MAG: hypothetical protein NVS1B10_03590 [Candidatus Saccharimonadales bacterium]
MKHQTRTKFLAIYLSGGLPWLLSQTALAVNGDVGSVEGFIKSIIKLISGLAGLIATGFIVVGGIGYITSSGNPEHLDRSKRTITHAAVGLTIVISAFVVSNIIANLATTAFGS